MKNNITLDLVTTLSITSGYLLNKNYNNLKIAIENFIQTELTDEEINTIRPIIKEHILKKYPYLERIRIPLVPSEKWLNNLIRNHGNIFTFEPLKEIIETKKR